MVEPDVAQALRTGPFAVALDVAVDASGLTLERLATRLGERGVHLSRATLSYWRSGRSQPERAASLAALPVLEDLLGLPAGSLHNLLRSRDEPRAARRPPGSVSRRRLWPARPALLAEVDAPPDGQLDVLSVDDLFVVEGTTGPRLLRVRMVVRAIRDGVSRTVVFYEAGQGAGEAPRWAGFGHCRLGRVRTNASVTVAELILDRRLALGECTVLDYELRFAADGESTDTYHRSFTRPCGLWTCQVSFTGDLPSRVFRYRQRQPGDGHRDVEEVWLSSDRSALTVVEAVRPGIVGMYWH